MITFGQLWNMFLNLPAIYQLFAVAYPAALLLAILFDIKLYLVDLEQKQLVDAGESPMSATQKSGCLLTCPMFIVGGTLLLLAVCIMLVKEV